MPLFFGVIATNVVVSDSSRRSIEDEPVEVVERKGIGHPDSVADGVAEAASRALSRFYLSEYGRILHHNLDKTLIIAGETSTDFGSARVVRQPRILIAGRVTERVDSRSLPIGSIACEAARAYVQRVCRGVAADGIEIEFVGGKTDVCLRDMFDRGDHLANDTSVGVSAAPYSQTEQLALDTESFIESELRRSTPGMGGDIKIMATRHGTQVLLDVAVAMLGVAFKNDTEYNDVLDNVEARISSFAAARSHLEVRTKVNWIRTLGLRYLTATGYSWENGDDGAVGRGNRVNGLATPNRPMSLEAVAGKNPVTHPGKLYNVLAYELAQRIAREHSGSIREATVKLVSRIGWPVATPQLASAELLMQDGVSVSKVADDVKGILGQGLSDLNGLTDRIVRGEAKIF